jgi:hypothetical protein
VRVVATHAVTDAVFDMADPNLGKYFDGWLVVVDGYKNEP